MSLLAIQKKKKKKKKLAKISTKKNITSFIELMPLYLLMLDKCSYSVLQR